MVILIMNYVVKVDKVGFVGAEKILTGQAIFNILQNAGKKVFFSTCGDYSCVPASGNATKNLFHAEKLDSPGGFDRYFRCIHTLPD